jgi:hypothetical protein
MYCLAHFLCVVKFLCVIDESLLKVKGIERRYTPIPHSEFNKSCGVLLTGTIGPIIGDCIVGYHQNWMQNESQFCLVFWRLWVEILAQRPTLLTEDFRVCLTASSSKQMSVYYLSIGHDRFLSYPLQFIIRYVVYY